MAVPFRKVSKTRKRARRSHNALGKVETTTCPNCGATIKPHRVCKKCGSYKGTQVIEEKKEKDA